MNPLLPAIKTLKPSLLPVEVQYLPTGKLTNAEDLANHSAPLKDHNAVTVNVDNPDNWDDRWFADYE